MSTQPPPHGPPGPSKFGSPESSPQQPPVQQSPVQQSPVQQPPVQQGGAPRPTSGSSGQVIMVLVALVGGFVVLGIVAALAIYGVSKYVERSKAAEVEGQARQLAQGMCGCGADGQLPDSTDPVPPLVPSSAKYMAPTAEWEAAGFCTSLDEPQYAQFQWFLESPTRGRLVASSDLDGDGQIDEGQASFALATVLAADGSCQVGAARPTPASSDVVVARSQDGLTRSIDGALGLRLPGDYKALDPEDAAPGASLFAGNEMNERYIMVLPESAADFVEKPSAQGYLELVMSNMSADGGGQPVGTPRAAASPPGVDASEQRFDGVVDNIRISYLITVFKAPDSYQQVLQWTLSSRYEEAEPGFRAIARTCQLDN